MQRSDPSLFGTAHRVKKWRQISLAPHNQRINFDMLSMSRFLARNSRCGGYMHRETAQLSYSRETQCCHRP